MSDYNAPDFTDGLKTLRMANSDTAVRYTDDPKRPIELITSTTVTPLFLEAAIELSRILMRMVNATVTAGVRSKACVYAEHATDCTCGSIMVSEI